MQITLKLHSNAFAKCDQKGLYCKHFQYINAQISEKHPPPQKKSREPC